MESALPLRAAFNAPKDDELGIAGHGVHAWEQLAERALVAEVLVGDHAEFAAGGEPAGGLAEQAAGDPVVHRVAAVERRVEQNQVELLVDAFRDRSSHPWPLSFGHIWSPPRLQGSGHRCRDRLLPYIRPVREARV